MKKFRFGTGIKFFPIDGKASCISRTDAGRRDVRRSDNAEVRAALLIAGKMPVGYDFQLVSAYSV